MEQDRAPEDGDARMRRVLTPHPCAVFKKKGKKGRRVAGARADVLTPRCHHC
jgi:hypothetical protein